MVNPKNFIQTLKKYDFEFFCGIPDSLLQEMIRAIEPKDNIIAANEGTALSIACGYHIATGRSPVVYLQNSGLGNLCNPLISIAHSSVFDIPILFIIGWRGEPNLEDEPQHIFQGSITEKLLRLLDLEYRILDAGADIDSEISAAHLCIGQRKKSYALLVRKDTFEMEASSPDLGSPVFSRHDAIKKVFQALSDEDRIVATTGFISRELYEISKNKVKQNCFFTIGSMGHASQIALGVAIGCKNRVFIFDGDGAFIMHMGGIATISQLQPKNLYHIVYNNGAHDSVGGQQSAGHIINISNLAKTVGYKEAFVAKDLNELENLLPSFLKSIGPSLLEIKIDCGSIKKVGRPTELPSKLKLEFMNSLIDNVTGA